MEAAALNEQRKERSDARRLLRTTVAATTSQRPARVSRLVQPRGPAWERDHSRHLTDMPLAMQSGLLPIPLGIVDGEVGREDTNDCRSAVVKVPSVWPSG
jgi:hypothetical protein